MFSLPDAYFTSEAKYCHFYHANEIKHSLIWLNVSSFIFICFVNEWMNIFFFLDGLNSRKILKLPTYPLKGSSQNVVQG
jgi:hypothetical protein